MNVCGFDIGNDKPIFLIAGTCVVESEQMTIDTAGTLKEDHERAGHSVHLQVLIRQGQSFVA